MSQPFTTPGSNVPVRVVFNSGTIDFGGTRLVELDNITMKFDWTTKPLYILGSIKPQDLVRSDQKITLTGKLKSFPPEMSNMAFGSSTLGTPEEIDTLDGQPTYQNPVVTLFDRNNKQVQYQLSGAIWKSYTATLKMEEYAEFDFELECKDMTALVYSL